MEVLGHDDSEQKPATHMPASCDCREVKDKVATLETQSEIYKRMSEGRFPQACPAWA